MLATESPYLFLHEFVAIFQITINSYIPSFVLQLKNQAREQTNSMEPVS